MTQQQHAASELERAKRLIRKIDQRTQENGCSEAEALEAAAKIGELLATFDLSMDEIIVREEKCITKRVFAADDAIQPVITGIGALLTLRTYAEWGKSPVTFVLFGMERDMELAIFLYEICVEAADHGWADFIAAGHGHTRKQRESFRRGFGTRLYHRMRELKAQRDEEHNRHVKMSGAKDLVLVRDAIIDEEFAKTGVKLTTKEVKIHDRHAYYQGDAHGATVNLNSPLEDGTGRELLA